MASLRKTRRTELLRDAASHGPYLWSDLDVENALLWFQGPSSASSSSSSSFGGSEKRREDPRRRLGTDDNLEVEEVMKEEEEVDLDEEEEEEKEDEGSLLEEGCEFLRRLLHAPGGESGYERPPPPTLRDDHGERRRRQRRRNHDDGGVREKVEKKKRGRSSARSTARGRGSSVLEALGDDDVGGRRREEVPVEKGDESEENDGVGGGGGGGGGSNAPLRSVLLGYYRLFLLASSSSSSHPSSSSSSSTSNDNTHDEDEGGPADDSKSPSERCNDDVAAKAATAGMAASARLLSDLIPIVSARRGRARDVRRAYASVVDREGVAVVDREGVATTVGGSSASFDEYATRPTACANAAYASIVYDRLVDLCGEGTRDAAGADADVDNDATPRSTAPPALRGFLRKLLVLAETDAKIREVALLVLLEPTRRSQVDRLNEIARRRDDDRRRRRRSRPSESPCEEAGTSSVWTSSRPGKSGDVIDAPPTAGAQLLHGAALASASNQRNFFSAEEDAEGVCTRPPLSLLVRSILRSSRPRGGRRATADGEDDDDDGVSARRATTTAAAAMAAAWWTLPSPLLCAVSHASLPIASEYVRYWIEMAAIGHAKLYDGPLAMDHPEDGRGMAIGDRNNNGDEDEDSGELFRRAICRIIQFRSTSDRLDSLCRHALHSIDGKSTRSSVENYSKGDDDEDVAFKTSLAWKAIHRALER